MHKNDPIIYRRIAARQHDEVHGGGAWKVAFADFMIALMALFLVLWVMQPVEQNTEQEVPKFQPQSSIFNEGSGQSILNGHDSSIIDFEGQPALLDMAALLARYQVESSADQSAATMVFETQQQLQDLANVIEHLISQISAQDNVLISVTPQGVRIVLQDNINFNMFLRGSSRLTPFFEDLLFTLAPIFKQIENSVIISGHTDATQYRSHFNQITNWELSTNRANVARQTLVKGGMPSERVLQVIGMADKVLLNDNSPKSSENRRIELFILTTEATAVIDALFGAKSQLQTNPT